MNDVEDRLRDSLRDLAEPVQARVDIDDLRADGDRLRRRRRRHMIAPVIVGAALVGLIGYGLTGQILRTGPDPAGTPAVPLKTASVSVALPKGSSEDANPVVATISLAGDVLLVSARGLSADGKTPYDARADRRLGQPLADSLVHVGGHLYLGVLPGQAQWVDPQATEWVDIGSAVVPSLNVTVYLLGVYSGDLSPVTELVWQGLDGIVHLSTGEVLPSAALNLGDHVGVYYLNEEADTFGLHSPTDGNQSGTVDRSTMLLLDTTATKVGGHYLWFGQGFLPVGARDPEVVTAHPLTRWTSLTLGDRILIVVTGDTADDAARLLTSLTYTDATGRRITQTEF